MFKRNLIAVSLAFAALASAQASAAVVGGGATLPEKLYGIPGGTVGILNGAAGFNDYIGVGSSGGKRAFFNNDATEFDLASGITVDYAGSDSVVSEAERDAYNAHATLGAASFGPLVQLPSAATSVTVPFNVPGLTSLDLSSQQLANIFAGTYTNWNQVPGLNGPNLPIRVVYRADGSGTTEIFLRHLMAAAPSVVPGTLDNDFVEVISPISGLHIPADGSSGIVAEVYGAGKEGSIGYVSPDYTDFDNPAEVARINGLLPEEVNVVAALDSITLPLVTEEGKPADPANPLAWVPASQLANPSAGYSIVGVTNLVFSQCYQDSGDLGKIQDFTARHYNAFGANNDAEISAHSLIPLPFDWKVAVEDTFVTNLTGDNLDIGNTSVCNGIGRPL
ncbi:MAG: alkaline phosphatase [Rhodobacteraceae bacterium]|nr:alkaline phosphatase [Paracoccaceae bacterium]|tara:strand:- start:2099 stop:3274 length:1176 start_codon:yes stop_codon:yes gene_type:complete